MNFEKEFHQSKEGASREADKIGEDIIETNINSEEKMYRKLEEESAKTPEMQELFGGFQMATLRYAEKVNVHEHMSYKARISGFDPETVERL
jgi:hypothetical protein